MSNQSNDNKIGNVKYSSSTISKLGKTGILLQKGGRTLGIGGTLIIAGYILGSIFGFGGSGEMPDGPIVEQPSSTIAASSPTTLPGQATTTKNDFNTNNNYAPGDVINISDCDFSGISVVLDAADETDKLYAELLETQKLFATYGIDCTVTSYYDSAIDEIERIKSETGKTVFAVSVQTNQNKTDEHLIATNFYNNDDALGKTTIAEGDPNSADAFALSVETYMPGSALKKGLADDYSNYDRRASQLEQDINERGLEGVKAITIRTSEISPLSSGQLGTILLNGLVRASTVDNDQTYFVRATSWDGFPATGTIKDKYGYEEVYGGGEFYSDSTILAREKPAQLTNQVGINYGDPIEVAYQTVTSAKSH